MSHEVPEAHSSAYDHALETLGRIPQQRISEEDRQLFLEQWRGALPGSIAPWEDLPPIEQTQERNPASAAA